ncbi:hypothetical protein PINS_up020537 [Pythium insidiosum]|nr:hypothetical protein PINS_up020537 [Pythium insidiosum]
MSKEAADKQRVEALLLQTLNDVGTVGDSFEFAQRHGVGHDAVVGVMKSLLGDTYVTSDELSTSFFVLKDEGKGFLVNGSPEVQVFNAIPERRRRPARRSSRPWALRTLKVGQGACMKNKWIRLDRADGKFYRNVRRSVCLGWIARHAVRFVDRVGLQVESVVDEVTEQLRRVEANHGRAHVRVERRGQEPQAPQPPRSAHAQVVHDRQGPNFSLQRKKQAAGLTKEMLEGYVRSMMWQCKDA